MDHNGYCIVCNSTLIFLYMYLVCIAKHSEEVLTCRKDRTDVFLRRYDKDACFSTRCNVHLCTHVTDASNSFLNLIDSSLVCLEIKCLVIFRPLGNHDRFLVGQCTEDLLCYKRHIWMQQLQTGCKNGFQCPECCCLCLICIIPESWFYHLDIPVTELLPQEIVKL